MPSIRQAVRRQSHLHDVAGLILGIAAVTLGVAVHILIPYHVSLEPVPGAARYVLFTPAAVPRVCATAFVVLGLLQIYTSLRAPPVDKTLAPESPMPAGATPLDLAVLAAALVAYPTMMVTLGYPVATVMFLLFLLLYGGERKLLNLLICCIAVPAAIYWLFASLMAIPLPLGRFFE